MKRTTHVNDPQVSTAPLRRLLAEELSPHYCCMGHSDNHDRLGYGLQTFSNIAAARFDLNPKTIERWVRKVRHEGTISLYVADHLCAALHVPFGYIYCEETA